MPTTAVLGTPTAWAASSWVRPQFRRASLSRLAITAWPMDMAPLSLLCDDVGTAGSVPRCFDLLHQRMNQTSASEFARSVYLSDMPIVGSADMAVNPRPPQKRWCPVHVHLGGLCRHVYWHRKLDFRTPRPAPQATLARLNRFRGDVLRLTMRSRTNRLHRSANRFLIGKAAS